jgi:methionyl aminopeptidase
MFGTAGTGIKLKAGMTLAIEPMVNMGKPELYLNGWDARTRDHQPSAHYENTVLITPTGAEILTKKLEANNFE